MTASPYDPLHSDVDEMSPTAVRVQPNQFLVGPGVQAGLHRPAPLGHPPSTVADTINDEFDTDAVDSEVLKQPSVKSSRGAASPAAVDQVDNEFQSDIADPEVPVRDGSHASTGWYVPLDAVDETTQSCVAENGTCSSRGSGGWYAPVDTVDGKCPSAAGGAQQWTEYGPTSDAKESGGLSAGSRTVTEYAATENKSRSSRPQSVVWEDEGKNEGEKRVSRSRRCSGEGADEPSDYPAAANVGVSDSAPSLERPGSRSHVDTEDTSLRWSQSDVLP